MGNILSEIKEAGEYIKKKIGKTPQIAVVLGSGLGALVNEIEEPLVLDYGDIPGFPVTTVEGHDGKLIFGKIGDKYILAMKGRFHYYEGYDVSKVVFAIRVFKYMGINNLIVTNAAGGINKDFNPGDLMIIKDHISFFAPSALRGANIDEFGVRFPDMSKAYNPELIQLCKDAALKEGINVREGVYIFAKGPMYETPAEIRAMSILGADAVGMSTVPEVTVANHAGMNILGISCITNMAAGILDEPLSHEGVMEVAKIAEKNFVALVKRVVTDWEV
ncbi:purine-nucleoside phosphorylase [Acetivibrio saccincola]|jgi:purine-nucleoside phosphorylase|uniref:Purine nucleoside phosphorylase n=1 Tax=Acetivibrio saccincola TaxID=1677857 RepID=A0A2K9EK43_9FIRM|nr:purine-nucleoside phosphorylase [Acetivibrio saccincola]AUG58363.1 Purine nucleoside phosphorylase 1 [Acetivibrio saccincola]NLW26457.1 purine-nucleoside phosphorylase [Acetivibrio saccincola]HOA96915.1 purine-nucleoside phosphorylase [Acetivibrio saccincola]HQD29518.1 purine-nucleoside phosphorylase [Acetivibrio saccincola]